MSFERALSGELKLVLMSDDLFQMIADETGKKVVVEWGEPVNDALINFDDGLIALPIYVPTIYNVNNEDT